MIIDVNNKESIYQKAEKKYSCNDLTFKEMRKLIDMFTELGDYKDSKKYINSLIEKCDEIYFDVISLPKDSNISRWELYQKIKMIESMGKYRETEKYYQEFTQQLRQTRYKIKKEKILKAIFIPLISCIIFILLSFGIMSISEAIINNKNLDYAMELTGLPANKIIKTTTLKENFFDYDVINEKECYIKIPDCFDCPKEVVIPHIINGYVVVGVADKGFLGCMYLNKISIPSTIRYMGEYAFTGCDNIQRIDITDIDAWCNIVFGDSYSNPSYFRYCLYENGIMVRKITLPKDTTEIREGQFKDYAYITEMIIPEGVTRIDNGAFIRCFNLNKIYLPSTIEYIGKDVFTGCTSLTIYAKESIYSAELDPSWNLNNRPIVIYDDNQE